MPYQRPYIRRLIAEEKDGVRPRGQDAGDQIAGEADSPPSSEMFNVNVSAFVLCSPVTA